MAHFRKAFRPRPLLPSIYVPRFGLNERPHKVNNPSKFPEGSSFGSHFRGLQKLA